MGSHRKKGQIKVNFLKGPASYRNGDNSLNSYGVSEEVEAIVERLLERNRRKPKASPSTPRKFSWE